MTLARPWVILGNPENRRVSLFQQALVSRGLKPAAVLSYHGLLTGAETVASIPADAIVRIESPGENFEVEKLLLTAGADAAQEEGVPFLPAAQLELLQEDRGRILYPRQWYLGFIASCAGWFREGLDGSGLSVTTGLRNLELAFDKVLCHQACHQAGLPVPDSIGTISDWEDLVERLPDFPAGRTFIKLAHGSSASGVVALHRRKQLLEAITSVELVRTGGEVHLYNSLKIRRYTKLDDVRDLINSLAPHRVQVEEWLPKASLDRRLCDLRVVVVAGEPKQMVVRTSRSPLTNLHLGNRRGDVSQFMASVSIQNFEAMQQTCRSCAALFGNSLHLGLDVLFTPGFTRHYLLEVNAFGDLLPGVLHNGSSTYESQIDSVLSES